MILTRTIERKDFYTNYYKSLNFILNLSKKELAILSYFSSTMASLPRDYSLNQAAAMTFSSANRKIIADSLGISIYNLNNYIKSLTDKNIFTKRETNDGTRGIMINPKLWVDSRDVDTYSNEFKFNIV